MTNREQFDNIYNNFTNGNFGDVTEIMKYMDGELLAEMLTYFVVILNRPELAIAISRLYFRRLVKAQPNDK